MNNTKLKNLIFVLRFYIVLFWTYDVILHPPNSYFIFQNKSGRNLISKSTPLPHE